MKSENSEPLRIAIPTFGERISPRFDHAPGCELIDIEGDEIIRSTHMSCGGWRDIDRVSKLVEAKVDILICGALPQFLLGVLMDNNIRVIPWVAGEIQEVLDLFLQGRLEHGMMTCPGRRKTRCCRRAPLNLRSNHSISKEGE